MGVFERLAPYIQDYICREDWHDLRKIQIDACEVILDSDCNLLLSSGTASGKTEAAFLPTLTDIYYKPSRTVGILYISPLKALINDQFERIDYLLLEGNIPVCKWHGDASRTAKNKMLKKPQGVLQITPESMESLLINRQNDCIRLFSDLRFIIIDEVHYFMNTARGIQLLCQLERLQRLTENIPRRIGLSATLGDCSAAEEWLNSGSGRQCITPEPSHEKRKIKIAMEYFEQNSDMTDDEQESEDKSQFEFIYKNTLNKKCIIFCNSRHEVEFTIANLRKLALKNRTKDVYRVHHGSISAVIREDTEKEMKNSEQSVITGATVTLELGIDIGSLDMVVQIGAPFSVSSFTQRLGRCGRRGQTASLLFTFADDKKTASDSFAEMNWELLRAIAVLQLYLEENGWVEPIYSSKLPYTLLYHQTMAYLLSNGDVKASMLAQKMLSLTPFRAISQEDYKILLKHLLKTGHIEKTECGGLIIGEAGERVVNNFEFYSVFESSREYLVKYENEAIGTIDAFVPVGCRFSLAGKAWECAEVDNSSSTIFVKPADGIARNKWSGSSERCLHTKVLRKMREILSGNDDYRYMLPECTKKLEAMRDFAACSGFTEKSVTKVSDNRYMIFPWVGTKQLCALYFALDIKGLKVIMDEYAPYYLEVVTEKSCDQLIEAIKSILQEPVDKYNFNIPDEAQIPYKYNNFIPKELLRKQFIEDYIDIEGLKRDFS